MILAAAMNPETFRTAENAIARLRRGDTDRLTDLLACYQHRLYRFLLRLVRDPAAAEDLFQQTWLRVMEKIGKYDAHSRFDTWNHSVLHLARSSPASLSKMRSGGGFLVPLLSCMRNSPGTDMSRVPSLRGAGLVALRTLRCTFAKG